MNKQEFVETFAHFMSEHDLNKAYDIHFPQLGNMSYVDIKQWLERVLENE